MVSRNRLVQSPGESESFAGAAATGAAGAAAADAELAGVALTRLEAGQFGACHHVLLFHLTHGPIGGELWGRVAPIPAIVGRVHGEGGDVSGSWAVRRASRPPPRTRPSVSPDTRTSGLLAGGELWGRVARIPTRVGREHGEGDVSVWKLGSSARVTSANTSFWFT